VALCVVGISALRINPVIRQPVGFFSWEGLKILHLNCLYEFWDRVFSFTIIGCLDLSRSISFYLSLSIAYGNVGSGGIGFGLA
jgi:hypothetical protein